MERKKQHSRYEILGNKSTLRAYLFDVGRVTSRCWRRYRPSLPQWSPENLEKEKKKKVRHNEGVNTESFERKPEHNRRNFTEAEELPLTTFRLMIAHIVAPIKFPTTFS